VLADSAAGAEDGVEAIAFEVDELPVVADRYISNRQEALLFEDAGTNLAMQFTAIRGDADAAFRDAEYTKRAHFAVQRHTALPLEPRGLLAQWDAAAGRLTVMGAAKVPFFNRRTVAQMMGLSESAVDLIENDVGGGFGARGEFYPEDFLIPFAARYAGRTVLWIEDRREHLTAINHARQMDCEVEIACKRDGTILGLRGDVFVDLGAYVRTNGLIAPRNVVQLFSGPYRIPNIRSVPRHWSPTRPRPAPIERLAAMREAFSANGSSSWRLKISVLTASRCAGGISSQMAKCRIGSPASSLVTSLPRPNAIAATTPTS
jgi:carbon-monoxide dehydrogenase large subunit